MDFYITSQSKLQFGNLAAQPPFGQFGHLLRGGFTFRQSFEYQLAGDPEDVAGHAGQFDVRRLQQLPQPIALRTVGNKAGAQQSVTEQVSQPLRVLTSLLRPGTFLTCCALAMTISNVPFRIA